MLLRHSLAAEWKVGWSGKRVWEHQSGSSGSCPRGRRGGPRAVAEGRGSPTEAVWRQRQCDGIEEDGREGKESKGGATRWGVDANQCLQRVWCLWDYPLSKDVDLLGYCVLSTSCVPGAGSCIPEMIRTASCPGGAHSSGEGRGRCHPAESDGYRAAGAPRQRAPSHQGDCLEEAALNPCVSPLVRGVR